LPARQHVLVLLSTGGEDQLHLVAGIGLARLIRTFDDANAAKTTSTNRGLAMIVSHRDSNILEAFTKSPREVIDGYQNGPAKRSFTTLSTGNFWKPGWKKLYFD
jgi:hypothetical protein